MESGSARINEGGSMILNEQDIRQVLAKMKPPKEAAYIKSPKDVRDEVVAAFHDTSFGMQGYPIHFANNEHAIRFRHSEVTIWTGENHTGKSEILNQFILSQTAAEKSFIMSPEMPLYRTTQYMCQQACAVEKPRIDQIDKFLDYIHERIYLLDQESTFLPQDVLDLIRYVHSEYGVFHIVIDSLMKCGMNENDDHAKIKWFVDQLCVLAKNLKIHIHLVAHSKKPQGHGGRPSRYDIKGTGAISDLVDNVIIMWRNEEKEKKIDEGVSHANELELDQQPDARMIIEKQRHGTSWKGAVNLWHDSASRSFRDQKHEFQPTVPR
jgi:twinkle protein